ncbi:MAG: hypothetical protein IJL87_10475 [Clostridia bacterium]|nr:hypothetical protein [Clostridia bacterium]
MTEPGDFATIGYFICKFSDCPHFLGINADRFISASDCLCDHEPKIFLCHGWQPGGDNQEYINTCFLGKEEYNKMSEEISELFAVGAVLANGMFLRKEDAKYIYKEYFCDEKHILVSVSTKKEYLCLLDGVIAAEKNTEKLPDEKIIGNDIIGWDISGFHSFLCNSLHERFDGICFNKYGLLDEDYGKTEERAKRIAGLGEPVDWFAAIMRAVQI